MRVFVQDFIELLPPSLVVERSLILEETLGGLLPGIARIVFRQTWTLPRLSGVLQVPPKTQQNRESWASSNPSSEVKKSLIMRV